MADKVIKTRVQLKNDTTANWEKAITFIPLKGEMIIYNDNDGTAPKMKIGDGVTLLAELPFTASGSFLFSEDEPVDVEDGTVWIDISEEGGTINYVSYDAQENTETAKLRARTNIGAAFDEITTTMTVPEYENLSEQQFVELYARGVRTLYVENDGTFVDKSGIHYSEHTLFANGWVNGKQYINLSTVGATSSGELTLAKTATLEQVRAAASGLLLITAQNEGSIEMTSFGVTPNVNIPIIIRVVN